MANYNLTNQTISSSFQQLLQKDTDTGSLVDGLGEKVDGLTISGSTTSDFFIGDGSQLTNLPAGNIPDGTVSGSSQIILQDTTGDLSASRIDGTVAEAENAEHADAVQFPVIAKETLTKGDPVYVSGFNNGESKPEVLKADASDSSKMPVVGLAMVDASNNDHIFIAVAGNFSNVDTSTGLTTPQVGQTLYVASGGGYTNVKPTGTNLIQNIGVIGRVQQNSGEIVVSAIQRSNDLPNLTSGYIWKGDEDGVPQEFSTSSIAFTDKDNSFTGTQNFVNISVSGTGSFGVIESITGSAKIIGDAFIILNNDLPTERYAGVVVQDSGSGSPLTTSSFQYDGQLDNWFYEYSTDGGATTDHGVALFGPEYAVKGTPSYPTNNTLQKGDGGHHLLDSIITDNGTEITVGGGVIVGSGNNLEVEGGNILSPNGAIEGAEVAAANAFFDTIQSNGAAQVTISKNTQINGTLNTTGSIVSSDSIEADGNIVAPNGAIEGNELAAPNLFVDTIQANNASEIGISNPINVSGNLTASLQEGYVWVGNNSGVTTTVSTGSFGGGGGGTTVTNLSVVSSTASIDLSLGTKFYIDLPNATTTEIVITNRTDGDSFSLLVSQSIAGTGSISFGDDTIKFAGGQPYQPTNLPMAEDVVSFEIFNKDDGTDKYVYVSSVKNLY